MAHLFLVAGNSAQRRNRVRHSIKILPFSQSSRTHPKSKSVQLAPSSPVLHLSQNRLSRQVSFEDDGFECKRKRRLCEVGWNVVSVCMESSWRTRGSPCSDLSVHWIGASLSLSFWYDLLIQLSVERPRQFQEGNPLVCGRISLSSLSYIDSLTQTSHSTLWWRLTNRPPYSHFPCRYPPTSNGFQPARA